MSDDPSTAAGNDGDGLAAGDLSAWLAGMQRALDGTAAADVPCGDCTGCCTSSQFVPVGPDEVDTLAHIPPELLFPAPRMPAGHVLMGYDEHGRCPMLVGGACSIYAHRPRTCRTYDCRVFPATGVELDDGPGGDDAGKAEIARRSRRWRFTHPTEDDRVEHEALRAAARYVREHPDRLPDGAAPVTATQHAVLAVRIHGAFLGRDEPELSSISRSLP
jgi:Fe-S-cluster containining protein